jgi:hypothetical protein
LLLVWWPQYENGRTTIMADATLDVVPKVVFWHRELPPIDAEAVGEHTLEANSERVAGTIAHREELWDLCRSGLKRNTLKRLQQEVVRLGGRYAHILDETIETKRDVTTNEAWLHGTYVYMLYR